MTATPSPVKAERVVPILAVSDILSTVEYYVDGLGFRKTAEWVDRGRLRWCMLEYEGGAALMAQEGEPTRGPGIKGLGVKFYVWCDDAVVFYEVITRRGIKARKPFVGNGMHVVELQDPDGYEMAFQSPPDESDSDCPTD